ncbi:MAG: hypothetical protein RBR28_08350 [Lentimicrobium sp.]|jgi:hypothetical protein|nr:hypothetical protein [Lentimicrobium sp.]
MKSLLFICLMFIAIGSQAQVAINTDGSNPDNSAMLDVKSTVRGLLAPRMTQAQRNAIASPATGLLIFQSNNTPGYYFNSGTPAAPVWVLVGSNAGQWQTNGVSIYYNLGNVGIGTATPTAKLMVAGDVTINDIFPFLTFNATGASDNLGVLFKSENNNKAWMYYSNDYNSMIINAEDGSGFRPDLTIKNTGNVGIGGVNAQARLHVFEDSPGYTAAFGKPISTWDLGTNVSIGDGNASAILFVGQGALNKGFIHWDYDFIPEDAVFKIGTFNGANPLNLQPVGGSVGIGINNPAAKLHVAENTPGYTAAFGTSISSYEGSTNVSIGDDNAVTVLYIGQSTSRKGFINWDYNATPVDAAFKIGTYGGFNPLILQSAGGNVGIGTNTPASRLDVKFDDNGYSLLGNSATSPSYFFHSELKANGDGQTALYAYRTRVAQNDGTGYAYYYSNSAVRGISYWGDLYSFGTTGFNYNDFTRCGGVLGAYQSGSYWGSLGYKSSGSLTYGGYFTSYTSGAGKSTQAETGIGIGAWGDLMGADIHGKIYGLYAEGGNYALFANGDVYKNKLDIHLQENAGGTNTVMYTNVSTEVTIQTSGVATLSNGKVDIAFDPSFTAVASAESPIIVTVTPIGNSNGVYLSEVSGKGFTVVENNAGKSSITVNYIAIAKRAGYEHPALSGEVVDASYTTNLSRGLHNDNDTQTNGEGLYYENGKLAVGIHPSTLPDPNKPAEETVIPKPGVPAQDVLNPNSPTGRGQYTPVAAPDVANEVSKIETPGSGSGKVQPIQQIIPENSGNKDWNASNKSSPEVTPDKVK